MISMRRQLFSILISTGIFAVAIISSFVNINIQYQFQDYVESTIEFTSNLIIKTLQDEYHHKDSWENIEGHRIFIESQVGNFAVSVLDINKNWIWGVTKEELFEQVKTINYPFIYQVANTQIDDKMYITKDIPIYNENDMTIIGYARIGYFPAFVLSKYDVIFQRNVNQSILIGCAITLGCFAIISYYIAKLFTKPVSAIAYTSVELAQGNYNSHYENKSRIKEIENLRLSMNYLAHRLEEEDSIRRKLVSDVSHEIRTPLHILQSNLEAMIDGIYPIDEEQIEILYKEVVRFGKLLSNLDKLKGIEDEIHELQFESTEINKEIAESFNTFQVVAWEKQLDYSMDIKSSTNIYVSLDTYAFKQIMMNLLSNAFKFTEKGKIKVFTEIDNKWLVINILDTGIGIANEDVNYVFDRMYRGDKSREKYEGSGIGLTIVKKLVTSHSGKIKIDSEEGKGTRMQIYLPIVQN